MPDREVIVGDGLAWLGEQSLGPEYALVTSLPDVSEFPGMSVQDWSTWFSDSVAACCRATHPGGVTIFYQTDVKQDGFWVDKSHLVHRGADAAGSRCVWHKIVCRVTPGLRTFGRPAYGHLQCFSAERGVPTSLASPDVIDGLGVMTWSRAMPSSAAEAVCDFLRRLETVTTVVDPFCGRGTILAVANHHGLHAFGVDISKKRVRKARALRYDQLLEPDEA
jgi:hypothetical protein